MIGSTQAEKLRLEIEADCSSGVLKKDPFVMILSNLKSLHKRKLLNETSMVE